jgi:phosphatidylserine decarboxylase
MRKLWFALLFLAGGIAHEVRHPVSCQCISARQLTGPGKRRTRRRAPD